jgi:heptosyltransferase-1
MGDVIHTWPLAVALRQALPDAEVAWLVEEPLLPLVAGHPAVGRAIATATRRWRRSPLSRTTRDEVSRTRAAIISFAADVAIDPQGLVKSGIWASLASVPRRIGFAGSVRRERLAGAFYTDVVTPPAGLRHVIDLNLSLMTALGCAPTYGALPDAGFLRVSSAAPADGGRERTIALIPGTGGAEKTWGASGFAELARTLAGEGWRPLVAWGPGERPLADRVAALSGGSAAVAAPTTLPELCRLLAACSAVVGGDTGPTHLAAALGVPTVAVHVATDAGRNAARGPRVNVVTGARSGGLGGGARTGRARAVTADEVHAALADLLEERQ